VNVVEAVCVSPVNEAVSKNVYVPSFALLVVYTVSYNGDYENVNTVESIAAPADVVRVYVRVEHAPVLTVKAVSDLVRVVPEREYELAAIVEAVTVYPPHYDPIITEKVVELNIVVSTKTPYSLKEYVPTLAELLVLITI
jgi:hypothetical protein